MGAAAMPVMAFMQFAQGVEARDQAFKASRADEENARLSVYNGELEAMDVRRDARMVEGDQLAALAGSGAMLTGTATDLLMESEYQRELDVLAARRKAYGQAREYKARAKQTRREGTAAMIGGMFSAASTVLGGVQQDRRDKLARESADRFRGAPVSAGSYGDGSNMTGAIRRY